MAVIGAHILLYTSEPEALRATLRDVFGWKYVNAGDGWLIFALPLPSSVCIPQPGGVEVLLYEPRHPVAIAPAAR